MKIEEPILEHAFPTADCPSCKDRVSIGVVGYIVPASNRRIMAVICIKCSEILNFNQKAKIFWCGVNDLYRTTGNTVFAMYNRYNPKLRKYVRANKS